MLIQGKMFFILIWCCFNTLQIDIPTLVTENLGKEGLKHLETYLRAKEKGYLKYHHEC